MFLYFSNNSPSQYRKILLSIKFVTYSLVLGIIKINDLIKSSKHPYEHLNPFFIWTDSESIVLLTSISQISIDFIAPWNSSFFTSILPKFTILILSLALFFTFYNKYPSIFLFVSVFSLWEWSIQVIKQHFSFNICEWYLSKRDLMSITKNTFLKLFKIEF